MQQNINMGYKIILTILFLLTYSIVNAQTGIGTITPNASAKLDVSSTNKGFLPPRVALTATNIFAPVTGLSGATALATAAGLLVYNTATTTNTPNNVVPGYYYWNGETWIQISNGLIIDNSKNTSFTLAATDNNKVFLITSASAITVTVPSTLPIGFSCQIIQGGAGTITLAGSSVTLNSSNGLTTRATNSVIGLVMNTATTGFVMGDSIY
jgi:hypothetical protein